MQLNDINSGLVSVIIPTYNRSHTIQQSIESVLNQTYQNIEVILIDDGSDDDTKAVIETINDDRIRYFYQENTGACVARNNGIKKAQGKYIAFHDSDDIWYPKKLEKQMKIIKEKKYPSVVLCKSLRDDGDRKTVIPKRVKEGIVHVAHDLFGFGTHVIFGEKEVFLDYPFDPELERFQELEWLYRVLQTQIVYCIDEGLVEYAINHDSISNDDRKIYRSFDILKQKHPEIRRESPAIAMHAVRDLVLIGLRSKTLTLKEKAKCVQLITQYYPGMGRYWFDRYMHAGGKTH